MKLHFHGAARTVTGSMHRLEVNGVHLLLDCGLFQGTRKAAFERNRQCPFPPAEIHNVVLSHAHIDHSGNLPSLVKRGFGGNIYATPPTRDLCSVMLTDAAMLQEQDARYMNKRHRESDSSERVEPLYTLNDVHRTMAQFVTTLSDWVGRPVIDKTGLTGLYDFTLTFAPEGRDAGPLGPTLALLGKQVQAPPVDPNAPSLAAALQEQLGLRLEGARGPVEVVVIDRLEKPTPD